MKRHKPSLLFTSLTILTSLLLSQDNFYHKITFITRYISLLVFKQHTGEHRAHKKSSLLCNRSKFTFLQKCTLGLRLSLKQINSEALTSWQIERFKEFCLPQRPCKLDLMQHFKIKFPDTSWAHLTPRIPNSSSPRPLLSSASQKPSPGDISGTENGRIYPLVSKRPEKYEKIIEIKI